MQQPATDWREILRVIQERVRPETLAHDISHVVKSADDDEDMGMMMLGTLGTELMVISAGMAAMYVEPPQDPLVALEIVARELGALDFETGIGELEPEEQRMVRKYVEQVKPLFADWGRVMQAIFSAYVREDYDEKDDPNELLAQAETHLPMEPYAALRLLGRAGAIALRGRRWWWRWAQELMMPLGQWVTLAEDLIDVLLTENEGPLGSLELQRERWHTVMRQEMQDLVNATPADLFGDALVTGEFEDESDDAFDDEDADAAPFEELLDELFQGHETLSKRVIDQFVARGDELVPELIEIATDTELWADDAEGDGWASIHAVELLSKLRAVEAVPPLIEILSETGPDEILHDRALVALTEIGSPAGRAVLETIQYTRNKELKQTLTSVLGDVGRDEPETFKVLARLYDEFSWDEYRMFVVWSLAKLNDPRAIPILERAWRDPKLSDMDVEEIAAALESYGVEPTPPRKRGARFNPLPMRSHSMKLGRNDPCWCGSGKKYKQCHLAQDESGTVH